MARQNIEPFYFGPGQSALFGCYHAPQSIRPTGPAVVLCCPLGREYVQFHRAYRQLAVLLSEVGYPTLRFDFFGCGDSSGDWRDWGLDRWVADISTAIGEMRRISGAERISLVGLRLGGTVAAMAAGERGDIHSLVLWDPVVSGRAYVDELGALHEDMLRHAHVKSQPGPSGEAGIELLGFAFTQPFLDDLRSLDLLEFQGKAPGDTLLIQTHPRTDQRELRDRLSNAGARVDYRRDPVPQLWTWIEDFGQMLVPHQLLQSVVAWISKVGE